MSKFPTWKEYIKKMRRNEASAGAYPNGIATHDYYLFQTNGTYL